MSTDQTTQLLQAARPATEADHAWAFSPHGMHTLTSIQHRITRESTVDPRTSRTKRGLILAAVGAAVAGSLAFTVLHVREPAAAGVAMCNQTASTTSNGAGVELTDPTPAGARAACDQRWIELWPNTPRPAAFAVCTFPASDGNTGGGQVVIPARSGQANDAACTAAGFALIVGAPHSTG